MKNPVPVKAMVTIAMRTTSGDGNELNASCKIAQNSDSPKICSLGKKPPASMIGNRYRSPRDTKGFVPKSKPAIERMRTAATDSDFARFFGAYTKKKSTNRLYTPDFRRRQDH